MDLDEGLQAFVAEAGELLAELEGGLLHLEQDGLRDEFINAIFRAAHTIKGTASLFSLDHVVVFTHAVESLLEGVREGRFELDAPMQSLLLGCADHIGAMVRDVERGGHGDLGEQGLPQLEALHRYLDTPLVRPAAQLPALAGGAPAACWHISIRFGGKVFRDGMDPASFIGYLGRLGRIAAIAVADDAIPPAARMDPETCYLGFEIALETTAGKAAIEQVFEFVQHDCSLHVLPPGAGEDDFRRLVQDMPQHARAIAEVRRAIGRPLQLPVALPAVPQPTADVSTPPATPAPARHESRTIRVDADRLGHLITLVGELIIASARTNLIGNRLQHAELQDSTSLLAALVEEVRDTALQLRMVKIGATFNRFQRVVHDVARETGKDIRLLVSGEDVELDKTLVERIGDPLTHLVRNAIDHGIEPLELRQQRGKPPQGTVSLNAFHDSGSIVIEVGDDGGGLQRDRIVAKAVQQGLVEAEQKLTDEEALALVFEPGFSTAAQVTSLSGRGVGMDVVKRNIEALRGNISISSSAGQGTLVRVRLPLTLAIIDCLLVTVASSHFAVPLSMVEECVEYHSDAVQGYTDLRGAVLPTASLREAFHIGGVPPVRSSIVVVQHAGVRAGLVVDTLLGQVQAVIKPLSALFSGVHYLSGSTILGGGEVALILDVPVLLKECQHANVHTYG